MASSQRDSTTLKSILLLCSDLLSHLDSGCKCLDEVRVLYTHLDTTLKHWRVDLRRLKLDPSRIASYLTSQGIREDLVRLTIPSSLEGKVRVVGVRRLLKSARFVEFTIMLQSDIALTAVQSSQKKS